MKSTRDRAGWMAVAASAALAWGCGGSATYAEDAPVEEASGHVPAGSAEGSGAAGAQAAAAPRSAAFGGPSGAASACNPGSDGQYYVDPAGTSLASCAYRTITEALVAVGTSPAAGTRILVLGPSTVSAGETFPIVVPHDVTIEGHGGTVTVRVPSEATSGEAGSTATGFVLGGPGAGLQSLTIDGQSLGAKAGVLVTGESDTSTFVEDVVIRNFTAGDGIRITGTAGLTVGPSTLSTGNVRGLYVTESGKATLSNPDLSTPIVFSNNAQYGILVDTVGSITVSAAAGALGAGSVVTSGNRVGVAFMQYGPGSAMPASTVTGLVAWQNTTFGMEIQGGSSVKVRESTFGGNQTGVQIEASDTGGDDTSSIDLGTSGEPGRNVLQSPMASTGALTDGLAGARNSQAGVCFAIPAANVTAILRAAGNLWSDTTGTSVIDCTEEAPGALTTSDACTGGVDIGGPNVQAADPDVATGSCAY